MQGSGAIGAVSIGIGETLIGMVFLVAVVFRAAEAAETAVGRILGVTVGATPGQSRCSVGGRGELRRDWTSVDYPLLGHRSPGGLPTLEARETALGGFLRLTPAGRLRADAEFNASDPRRVSAADRTLAVAAA